MIDEKDLDLKYVVFKIRDINELLTEHERKLLWSFLTKIITLRKRIKENAKSFNKADELCRKQFVYEINQIPHEIKITGKDLRELLDKYDIK